MYNNKCHVLFAITLKFRIWLFTIYFVGNSGLPVETFSEVFLFSCMAMV